MSGGHYDYQYSRINTLADEIESEFIDYKQTVIKNDGYDIFENATVDQRIDAFIKINKLIFDLKECAHRAKVLEWFMSGDITLKHFLNEK